MKNVHTKIWCLPRKPIKIVIKHKIDIKIYNLTKYNIENDVHNIISFIVLCEIKEKIYEKYI